MRMDFPGFAAFLKEGGYIRDESQILSSKGAVAAAIDPGDGFPAAAYRAFAAQPECGVAVLSTAPFSLAAARTGRPVPALLDDQAQMAGRRIACVPDFGAVRGGPAKRRALLVQGRGCLCLGEDFYEALSMAMVAEKAALAWAASSYLGGGKRIGPADALVMRLIYKFKYGRRRAWKEA